MKKKLEKQGAMITIKINIKIKIFNISKKMKCHNFKGLRKINFSE